MAKGFNIRENNNDLELSINVDQFTAWVSELPKTSKGWLSLKIYKRTEPDPRGYTHNMVQVIRKQTAE